MSKTSNKPEFKCTYCGKTYKSYILYVKHQESCVMRQRHDCINTESFSVALELWGHSFAGMRKKLTPKDFISHKDYCFFMRLGEYCVKNNVIAPINYLDWCVTTRISLKDWPSDKTHAEYIKYTAINEDPVTAVMRSIDFIKSVEYDGYFSKTEAGSILTHIHMGRISPWFMLLYDCGKERLFQKSTREQKQYFSKLINTVVWNVLMKKNNDTCTLIRNILKNERF